MAMHPVQPLNPGVSTSGTGVVSIGPAGSTYTSMEQSGQSLLKTYCDDFPNTDKSFVIPPMFHTVYTEVMPENSRGLNTKEKNKYDGALKNQSGERAEKVVYDMINEILRKEISRYPFLALFNVNMDNDNKTKVRKHALLSELNGMDFTDIKTSGEFDCIIVVKDLGTIHIEVKRTNNVSNIASAESQLDSGVQFVTNIMNAIKGSQCNLSYVRLIAIPCESSKSPTSKTTSGSFVAHSDECQNFSPIWNTMIKELKTSSVRNTFTSAEFTTICNILMGWNCSEPVNYGSLKACKSNDSCLSLSNQITFIDEKVQHAEITSEEQKIELELKKQAPLSDVARTNPIDIFRNVSDISLLYLTPTQQSLYYHFPHAIVHGHGGTGKTILCLMKMMDLVRSGTNRKSLFVAPSPSHLYCHSTLVKNKFNACIVKEVPLSKEAKCDIVIITLNDFFNDAKIADASNLSEYDIFFDDLQDYYTENFCNDLNLNRISEFIQKHFIIAKNNNRMVWFCFDIVQSTSLKFDMNNLICFFPQLEPNQSAPPVVNLKHVLRNTSEIISTVEEGRNTALAVTVYTKKIVKEFFKGHSITSSRVLCHRLNSSADPTSHEQFVLEVLQREVESLAKTKQALQLSHIAILVDNDSVLTEYKKKIDQTLSNHFKSSSQTIEESIISQQKDRVILDFAKNVASFESPCVAYIRTENVGQVYRMISRARTRLTIIDVAESPLPYESIDHIEWSSCKTGFYNVTEIMDALHYKDMEQIEKLVSENPECLKLIRDGLTPFLLASQVGSVNTIEICINHGAKPYEKDLMSGQTGAMLAARYGHLEALKYLVSKGVPIEEKDKHGKTFLHHAVEGCNVECVRWIIQSYPQSAHIFNDSSILHEVASAGSIEMLKVLHDCGVRLNQVDDDGNIILHHAVEGRNVECTEWVIGNYLDNTFTLGKEVIDVEMLQILRDQGINLEKTDKKGDTILHCAVHDKQVECVRWIIKNYPQIAFIFNNTSIFHDMASAGNLEMLQVLHDCGVCLDKVDKNGNTIIDRAAISEEEECLHWALHSFPHLVDASTNKTSIIHKLAYKGNIRILQNLLNHGINLEEADDNGNTILHHAEHNKQIECVKWILKSYPQLPYIRNNERGFIFHEIASAGNLEMLKIFHDYGISLDEVDNDGNTVLDYSAIGGQDECFKWFLQNYPQLSDTLKRGKTSTFHQVAKNGHLQILEILRNEGVNLEQADGEGNTILHHTVSNRKYDCFVWILQNYPQLVETTKYKKSSLLLEVASLEDYEMLELLCTHEELSKDKKYQKSLLHKAAISHSTEELRTLIENEIKPGSCDNEETNMFLQKVHGDVTIFRDNGLVFKGTQSTVYLPLAWLYKGCKVYFEIEVVENKFTAYFFSISLINNHLLLPQNRRDKGAAYWDGWLNKLGVKRYTVGVAIDMINCQILYINAGKSTKPITFSTFDEGLGLLPAINGHDITLEVNFGVTEFKYSPPDSTYKGVEELIKGTNILHVSARKNQADCCKYIIDTYPHLLNKTSGRGTPLHECASTGSLDSLQVLLDAGADMTITNIFGLTALHMAKINDQPECQKELERRLNGEERSVSKGKKALLSRLRQNFRKK